MKLVISWYTGGDYECNAYQHVVPTEYESAEAFICNWEKALKEALAKFEHYSKITEEYKQKKYSFFKQIAKIKDEKKKEKLENEFNLLIKEKEDYFKNNSFQSFESFIFAGIRFYCLEHYGRDNENKIDKNKIDFPTIQTLEEWFESNNAIKHFYDL